jgi:hypothetical protein
VEKTISYSNPPELRERLAGLALAPLPQSSTDGEPSVPRSPGRKQTTPTGGALYATGAVQTSGLDER